MALTPAQQQVVAQELADAVSAAETNDQLFSTAFSAGVITLPTYLSDLIDQANYLADYNSTIMQQIDGTQPLSLIVYGTPLCFLAGTHVLTATGEVRVETLKAGDTVMTMSGASRPVRWVGYRHFDLARHPAPHQIQPIRIRADAFADGVPHRDLLLSPEHAVLRDGVLVPVRLLVNGASIVRETETGVIAYYHVELDSHDILMAENLQAESYLDTGNRGLFENAGLPLTLHPDLTNDQARRYAESCAPFADGAEQVEPIWTELAARAQDLGWRLQPAPQTTDDPGLHLLVDGRLIKPIDVAPGHASFLLPEAGAEVRLVSRSTVPSATRPWIADDRRLGVLLRSLTVRAGGSVKAIPLDHPALAEGWWDVEYHGPSVLRRWTNGYAVVPMDTVSLPASEPCVLEVEVATVISYPTVAEEVHPATFHSRKQAAA